MPPFGLNLRRFVDRVVAREIGEEEAYRAVYAEDSLYAGGGPAAEAPPGDAVECPLCGLTAGAFLPFGLDMRPNVQCPGCGSVERHRILWLYLRERTGLLGRPLRVLHTAPEPCLEPHLRQAFGGGYVSLDRYNRFAEVEADLRALPFAEAAFDLVLSSHVLEHVQDDRPALAELGRVLAPGGRALIMVPYDPLRPTYEDPAIDTPEGRLAAFGHPFHFRIYGCDLPARLAEAGLSAEVLDSRRLFDAATRARHRLNRNHLIDCRRPL